MDFIIHNFENIELCSDPSNYKEPVPKDVYKAILRFYYNLHSQIYYESRLHKRLDDYDVKPDGDEYLVIENNHNNTKRILKNLNTVYINVYAPGEFRKLNMQQSAKKITKYIAVIVRKLVNAENITEVLKYFDYLAKRGSLLADNEKADVRLIRDYLRKVDEKFDSEYILTYTHQLNLY